MYILCTVTIFGSSHMPPNAQKNATIKFLHFFQLFRSMLSIFKLHYRFCLSIVSFWPGPV